MAAVQAGLQFSDEFQASVANAPEGVTITYGLVEAVEGVTVNEDGTLQFGDITQDEVTIKIKAIPSASDNYTMETITLELTIRKEALSLKTVIQNGDATANQYEITLGDALPIFHVEQSASVLTNVPQPDSYQLYNANDEAVDAITQAGVYTIKPVYRQLPTEFGLYDITWSYAQLQVGELVIDETNASQFYSLIIDDGNDTSYTIGEWTNKDIIIKQAHPVFDRIRVGEGEASTTNYRYHVNGSQDVALSFCNAENACVQTSVELKYDAAAPEISSFTYTEINTSAFSNFLRMVTFDRYFRNAQAVSFHGSDEHSGIEGYRYELMNLDEEGNVVESTLVEDTISSTDTIELATNASYRIRAWAIDKAGNESGEKIERVYLNDQVAELEITATSNEQPYLGNTWTAQSIGIDLSSSSTIEVEYYEYSSDGQEFTRMSGNHIDIPSPLTNVNSVTYYFRGHLVDGSICEGSIVVKVDTIKPIISIQAASNDEPYEEGALAHHTIVLTPTQEAENISGVRYYYTTDESASTGDPRSVQGWIEVNGAIEHTTNGETTYYVKAVSGAGLVSDPVSFDVSLRKLEYNAVSLRTTSEEESYVQGSWAKGDVTFQLSGGIIDETLITGYEYTTTDGDTAPTSQAQWQRTNQASGHRIEETTMNKTYWFRPLPWSDEGQISQGVKVNLDVEVPSVPVITLSEVNTNMVARLLHEISFHNWFPYEVQATLLAEDAQSGIDHYEIEEVVGGETTTRNSQDGVLRYGENTEVVLRTRACDRAGNCSELSASEAIQIDLHAPMITGVEDTKTYVYYHRPRQIHVNDIGSGIAESTLQKPDGSIITIHEQEEIIQAGDYTIYAKDVAGNEITIRFTIRSLPGFDGLNGSDASYDIITNMIEEARQAEQDDINQSEYRDWINEAERIWKQYRVPSIVADDESGKIDSIQDTGFDPSLKLVVEKIEEDEIPQLPRKALYVYDVYLKKGNTVVQANGDVKVYLPYTHEDAPIIFQIDKDTNEVTQIPSQREGDYVTFTVPDLMKYAISNTAQELQRTEACTVGPDGNSNTDDDVCGIANDQGQEAIRNEDGSVDVPENGSIHFPNDSIIEAPDGAHIYPDGSVLLPDGTEYNPDGSKKEVNNDSNQDGIPDINIDIDCDGIVDINIDTDGDRKPDINIDTTGDGLPNYNVDIRNRNGELYPDGIPDINIGPVDWKETDICKTTDCGKQYCTSSYYKPYLNIDTDQDQLPDVNVDLDGDQEADINIDTDFDFIPNINIDTTGNGKPDINIDHDGDGKADENLLHVSEWKPTKTVKHGIEYDTMPNLKPDPALNPEDNDGDTSKQPDDSSKQPDDSSKKPDQTANAGNSTSAGKTSSNTSVKGNYQSNAGMGGANTGIQDFTIYYAVLCLFLASFMSVCIYRYRKH